MEQELDPEKQSWMHCRLVQGVRRDDNMNRVNGDVVGFLVCIWVCHGISTNGLVPIPCICPPQSVLQRSVVHLSALRHSHIKRF